MNLNELLAIWYSPSNDRYGIMPLMELLSVNFQAHERGKDTDFIQIAVAGKEDDAAVILDGIREKRSVMAG